MGQQPLCWRGSEKVSRQVGQEKLHAILGCSHQSGEKWLKQQKGEIVLHIRPIAARDDQQHGPNLAPMWMPTETVYTVGVCVFF